MQNLTKRILNCLSNLQPSKKEDEFKDQEDWNEGVGVRGLDLAAYQRQGEVDPDCKPNGFFKYLVIFFISYLNFLHSLPNNLLVQRGKDDMVKVVNRLQLSLELAQGIYENLLIRGHIFVIFGTENTIINFV